MTDAAPLHVTAAELVAIDPDDWPDGQRWAVTDDDYREWEAVGAAGARTLVRANPGVPSGGATTDVLQKASNSDFDVVWGPGGGSGGTSVAVLLHVQDRKASGTAGGTFTSGAWQTRTLNTAVTNRIGGASLAANQIALPAGTYWVEGSAPAWLVTRHALRLQDITNAATLLTGPVTYVLNSSSTAMPRAELSGLIVLPDDIVVELQHRCATTRATDGFGLAAGASFAVDHEVFADLRFWRYSDDTVTDWSDGGDPTTVHADYSDGQTPSYTHTDWSDGGAA